MSAIKPGILAQIVHPELWGKVVTVVRAAPAEDFQLPDGYWHKACDAGDWLCESMGSPFTVPTARNRAPHRKSQFAVINKRWLKPLPGLDANDSAPVVHELPLDAYGEPA